MAINDTMLDVIVQFSGGAEFLFGNKKKFDLSLNINGQVWTLKRLIAHLRDNYLKERPELFCSGDSVRPGILVLVNDVDWELLGDLDYIIHEGDEILFISTLHGG